MRYVMMSLDKAIEHNFVDPDDYSESDRDHRTLVVDTATNAVIGMDGGEPEDQLLYRNWGWVVPALNAAYEAGKQDARNE
jgi:hypothetical protein